MTKPLIKKLLGGLVVAGFAFVIWDSTNELSLFDSDKAFLFYDIFKEDSALKALEWTKHNEVYRIEIRGDQWVLTSPLSEKANSQEIEYLLTDLANRSFFKLPGPENWQDYGLDTGADEIKILKVSGEFRFLVNYSGAVDGKAYLRDMQSNFLYMSEPDFYNRSLGVQSLVEKYLFVESIKDVQELILSFNSPINIIKDKYGWFLEGKDSFDVGTSEVLRYIDGLNQLKADLIVEKVLVPNPNKKTILEVKSGDQRHILSIVKETKDFVVLSVDEREVYFQIPRTTMSRMNWDIDMFSDKGRPFEFLPSEVTQFKYFEDGKEVSLSSFSSSELEKVSLGLALTYLPPNPNFMPTKQLVLLSGEKVILDLKWESVAKKEKLVTGETIEYFIAKSSLNKQYFALSKKWIEELIQKK